MFDFGLFIVFEAVDDAEAVAEWAGEGTGAGGCADYGEVGKIEADGAGGWAFADYDVEFIVFHG